MTSSQSCGYHLSACFCVGGLDARAVWATRGLKQKSSVLNWVALFRKNAIQSRLLTCFRLGPCIIFVFCSWSNCFVFVVFVSLSWSFWCQKPYFCVWVWTFFLLAGLNVNAEEGLWKVLCSCLIPLYLWVRLLLAWDLVHVTAGKERFNPSLVLYYVCEPILLCLRSLFLKLELLVSEGWYSS